MKEKSKVVVIRIEPADPPQRLLLRNVLVAVIAALQTALKVLDEET
jgi:hypothetical protein